MTPIHRRALLLGAGAATLAAPALAQGTGGGTDWLRQPIRVVVPFPAGGTTDMLARLFGQRLSETPGQPMPVENRGGGGTSAEFQAMLRQQISSIRALVESVRIRPA